MIKNHKNLLILFVFCGLFIFISNSFALELTWPSLPGRTTLSDNTTLQELVQYFYEWTITLGGLAAFIAIIRAGFKYMSSAGNSAKTSEAKKEINSAFYGLLLLLSSFLILNTINPELVNLKMPSMTLGESCSLCIKDNPNSWQDACKQQCSLSDSGMSGPEFGKECNEVIVYPQTGFLNPPKANIESIGCKKIPAISWESMSVRIDGSCQVELYSDTACKSEVLMTLYGDTPDVSFLDPDLKNTYVNSVKVKNFGQSIPGQFGEPETPSCSSDCAYCDFDDCANRSPYCIWDGGICHDTAAEGY
jgi:hypothetical protein